MVIITRRVVHRHPELIERFIVLNCPHAKLVTEYSIYLY